MVTLAVVLLLAIVQSTQAPPAPEVPVLKAGLGSCASDFVVKDADGKVVELAVIHVRVRYGAMNVKRMDLEVSTNYEGRARVEGLPAKAKPLLYEIERDGRKGTAQQDLAAACTARHDVTLK